MVKKGEKNSTHRGGGKRQKTITRNQKAGAIHVKKKSGKQRKQKRNEGGFAKKELRQPANTVSKTKDKSTTKKKKEERLKVGGRGGLPKDQG